MNYLKSLQAINLLRRELSLWYGKSIHTEHDEACYAIVDEIMHTVNKLQRHKQQILELEKQLEEQFDKLQELNILVAESKKKEVHGK